MASPDTQPQLEPLKHRVRNAFNARPVLLLAFAFAVMADPVSSVSYAIEAALRALHGDLVLLLPTMVIVVGIVVLVIASYQQLVARFPEGGGAAAAAGAAFGEGWAFVPIGALVVDFVLTSAISASAAASALIAYIPSAASFRLPIALGVLGAVAGLTWFGHLSRAIFASMTIAFVGVGAFVIVSGFGSPIPVHHIAGSVSAGQVAFLAVLLAFPVAMASATGIEIPSSAIAQLGQLDSNGRRRFGRITLWLTLAIAGTLTLSLTALAVKLHLGIPSDNSTLVADIAKASVSRAIFALFQLFTALLLLAAASSAFQAGPGLFKALARRTHRTGKRVGVLHSHLGITNRHHTPYWALGLFFVLTALVVTAAGALDQKLVLIYAVSVFMSFMVGLIAMAKFSYQLRRPLMLVVHLLGATIVGFTLALDLARGEPILAIAAALLVALVLYVFWVRAGRPRGIAQAMVEAASELSSQ